MNAFRARDVRLGDCYMTEDQVFVIIVGVCYPVPGERTIREVWARFDSTVAPRDCRWGDDEIMIWGTKL